VLLLQQASLWVTSGPWGAGKRGSNSQVCFILLRWAVERGTQMMSQKGSAVASCSSFCRQAGALSLVVNVWVGGDVEKWGTGATTRSYCSLWDSECENKWDGYIYCDALLRDVRVTNMHQRNTEAHSRSRRRTNSSISCKADPQLLLLTSVAFNSLPRKHACQEALWFFIETSGNLWGPGVTWAAWVAVGWGCNCSIFTSVQGQKQPSP
jgi:hypothetical protein